MESVKAIWVVVFFLFSFVLLFIWSKLFVISKRIGSITDLVKKCEGVSTEYKADMAKEEK